MKYNIFLFFLFQKLFKIIPSKIEEQDFFKTVDDYNYWYFHRKNVT